MNYLDFIKDTVNTLDKYNLQLHNLSSLTETKILNGLRDLVKQLSDNKIIYNLEQLRQIVLGTEQNLAVEVYASTDYNSYQMEQIRLGQLHNIDVTSYTNPDNTWVNMQDKRLKLQYEQQLKNKKCNMDYLETMNFKDALNHTKQLLQDKTLSFDDRSDIAESFAQCYTYFDTSRFDKYFLAD